MIYCTLIYGKQWHEKFASNIVREAQTHDIYILTDHPEYFSECSNVTEYTRPVFSYYEKLNWVLALTKQLKQRVTYVDANWIFNLTDSINIEEDLIYTHRFSEISRLRITPKDRDKLRDLFVEAEYPWQDNEYISEKVISIPYLPKLIDKIIEDIKYLQPSFENVFDDKSNVGKKIKRYTEFGIGFLEGAALTAVANRYNIKYNCKKNLIRRKDLLM